LYLASSSQAATDADLAAMGLGHLPPCINDTDVKDWLTRLARTLRALYDTTAPNSVPGAWAHWCDGQASGPGAKDPQLPSLYASAVRQYNAALSEAATAGKKLPQWESHFNSYYRFNAHNTGAPSGGASTGPTAPAPGSFKRPPPSHAQVEDTKRPRYPPAAGGRPHVTTGAQSAVGSTTSRPHWDLTPWPAEWCHNHCRGVVGVLSSAQQGCKLPPGTCPRLHPARSDVWQFYTAHNPKAATGGAASVAPPPPPAAT
jgi:hypothetical protein